MSRITRAVLALVAVLAFLPVALVGVVAGVVGYFPPQVIVPSAIIHLIGGRPEMFQAIVHFAVVLNNV